MSNSDPSLPDGALPGAQRILRREDLARLRDADEVLRDAEARAHETRAEAERQTSTILTEAHARALREATRAAAEVVARAEIEAEEKLRRLEPTLARLVARTVREVVGALEPEEAAYLTALNALRQMRDHRGARIYTSADMVEPLRRAVQDAGPGAAEVTALTVDERLAPGRAILSSDRGHAEIGHKAVLDAALRPFDGGEE